MDGSTRLYPIAFNYGTAIGIGDPVQTTAGGLIQLASGTSPSAILGIFMGVDLLSGNFNPAAALLTNQNCSWPANGFGGTQNLMAWVIDDPQAMFAVQVTGGPWAASWRGQNIPIVSGTTGAPNTAGISTATVNGSAVATTNTLPFRINGLLPGFAGTPRDPTATNPWIEVSINFAISEQQQATGI